MTTAAQRPTDKEIRAQLISQLAEHLAGQPASVQSAHRWMKRVEVVGLGIVITTFAYALYGSFAWGSVNPTLIPIAWFTFATCLSLLAMLLGLHAILIRAFPPVVLPGKPPEFVSGPAATWMGVASLAGGLILAGAWVGFAYSTATFNLTMIRPLSNVLGVLMTIVIVYSLYQRFTHSR